MLRARCNCSTLPPPYMRIVQRDVKVCFRRNARTIPCVRKSMARSTGKAVHVPTVSHGTPPKAVTCRRFFPTLCWSAPRPHTLWPPRVTQALWTLSLLLLADPSPRACRQQYYWAAIPRRAAVLVTQGTTCDVFWALKVQSGRQRFSWEGGGGRLGGVKGILLDQCDVVGLWTRTAVGPWSLGPAVYVYARVSLVLFAVSLRGDVRPRQFAVCSVRERWLTLRIREWF